MKAWRWRVAALIGCRIRKQRLHLGLTQTEVAKLVESHRPIVSRVELGTHVPDFDTLAVYAIALGIPMQDFGECIDAAGTPPGVWTGDR